MIELGLHTIFYAIIIGAAMLMVIEYSYRQTAEDRRFIRILVGIVMVICAIWAGISLLSYPATALSINATQEDGQIIFQILDDEAFKPYQVWIDEGKLYDDYPGDTVIVDVKPGKSYTMTVTDSKNNTATTTVKAIYYTYPVEIWLLLLLTIILAIGSYFVPYAAFGAALTGGFLMLLIGPNPDYAGYLRLIACAAFILGLGAIFLGGER